MVIVRYEKRYLNTQNTRRLLPGDGQTRQQKKGRTSSTASASPPMATQFSYASLIPQYSSSRIHHRFPQKPIILRCSSSMKNNSESDPTTNTNTNTSSSLSSNQDSEPQNLLLKMAWYSSELLGIAASLIRPQKKALVKSPVTSPELSLNDSGLIDRAIITETIREDFQRSYFVTGNLTLDAYEEKCEFADPAGSFKGLGRFKRNCTNFGSLIEKSNMKLMKWEDFEEKSIGHWRFSCTLSFPWKPILSATGYTEYYFDDKSGKVCRHVEHWNVPKMTLLKQILRPSRRSSQKKADA